jgi:hypothetical protein
MSRGHLPMMDDMDFKKMVSGGGDHIFDVLYTNSDSELGPSGSDDV